MMTVSPRPARRGETPRRTPRRGRPRFGGYGIIQRPYSGSRLNRIPEQQAEMPSLPQGGISILIPPGLVSQSVEDQVSTNREPLSPSETTLAQNDPPRVFISYAASTGEDRISRLLALLKNSGDEEVQDPPLPAEAERFPVDEFIDEWFGGLEEDADSAGNPTPSQGVIDEARRIVLGLRQLLPAETNVHTWDDGEVAVEVFGARGRGFLLLCEPGGAATCVVTMGNLSRRARYDSSSILPDGFLREGLLDVRSVQEPTLIQEFALHPVVQEFSRGVDGETPNGNVVKLADRIVRAALIYTTGAHITFDDEEGYLDFHLRLSDGLLVMANVFPDGGIDASVYDDSQGPPVQVVKRMRCGTTTDDELIDLFRAGVHVSSF